MDWAAAIRTVWASGTTGVVVLTAPSTAGTYYYGGVRGLEDGGVRHDKQLLGFRGDRCFGE